MDFFKIGLLEFIDISLVALLIYQIYRLVKGTVAINIFIGISSIYIIWKIVSALNFHLLSEILGQFIGVGVFILAVIFQQELRKFLVILGKGNILKNKNFFKVNFATKEENMLKTEEISKACYNMSKSKTGAIIIISKNDNLKPFIDSGVKINSNLSSALLESIFYKNSPLHDGAIIIKNNKIVSVRCVLPVTNSTDFPGHLGMRHRAAVGITEQNDSIAVIVSEERGDITYVKDGVMFKNRTKKQLEDFLNRIFNKK